MKRRRRGGRRRWNGDPTLGFCCGHCDESNGGILAVNGGSRTPESKREVGDRGGASDFRTD
jgi:hypothetical protein